jgi:[ribosomal protein S5]-alanine N-acetyltransferase
MTTRTAEYLVSERLIFEPLSQNHISEFYVDWLNDIDVYKYLETGGDYSIDKLEKYVLNQYEKNILFWAIKIKETNVHIGNIKIDPLDPVRKSGEYGIMIGEKSVWGKGYAKEASIRIIDYCFNVLNFNSITLGVIEDNRNALMLYQKLGFKTDQILVKNVGWNGIETNSLRMSLDAKDFNG